MQETDKVSVENETVEKEESALSEGEEQDEAIKEINHALEHYRNLMQTYYGLSVEQWVQWVKDATACITTP